jgi:hypothetical protein
MNLATASIPRLDLPQRIEAILELARKHPAMWPVPKRLEFQLCAYLVAWETLALTDTSAHHALDLWREQCRRLHRKPGLTLADPIGRPRLPQRAGLTNQETSKAYQAVLQGLTRVYKATLVHYPAEPENGAASAAPARILNRLLADSLRRPKSFADPHGLEAYLLTLIELLELALAGKGTPSLARRLWRAEIRRQRSLGPSATRTLADVAPADVRAARRKALAAAERVAVVRQVVKSSESVLELMNVYLASRGRRAD